jgi:hypothetical protein
MQILCDFTEVNNRKVVKGKIVHNFVIIACVHNLVHFILKEFQAMKKRFC